MDALRGQQLCVVGATGMVGSTLALAIAETRRNLAADDPPALTCLSRRWPRWFPDDRGIVHIAGSVTAPAAMAAIAAADSVVYVAGVSSDYLERVPDIIDTQVIGLQAALSALRDDARLVYLSSTRVYGRRDGDELIGEEATATVQPMHLDNIYDAHKFLGESLCLLSHLQSGKGAMAARLTNVYGPIDKVRSETVLTDFVRQAVTTRRIVLSADPASVRNHCSVYDAVTGLLCCLAAGTGGNAYNIGSLEHLTTGEVATVVARAMPFEVEVAVAPSPSPRSVQRIDIRRAQSELGYEPIDTFANLAPPIISRTAQILGV